MAHKINYHTRQKPWHGLKLYTTWEVFYPLDGATILTTRYEVVARFFAWLYKADYEKEGQGWT